MAGTRDHKKAFHFMWVKESLLNVFAFLRYVLSNVCMCVTDRKTGQRQIEKERHRETETDKEIQKQRQETERDRERMSPTERIHVKITLKCYIGRNFYYLFIGNSDLCRICSSIQL